MNVGIVGYGRMGHEVENQVRARSHNIAFTVDPDNPAAQYKSLHEIGSATAHADVIIEFSLATAVLKNAQYYVRNGISVVVGTTGWEDQLKEVEKIVRGSPIVYLYGGNFSIGAHILFKVSKYMASLINTVKQYDMSILESHHTAKKDRPSGTALVLAKILLQELEEKKEMCVDIPLHEPVDPHVLTVVSQRIGHEFGTHTVLADSNFDAITVTHQAKTREGFALGAVLASEWVCSRAKDNTHTHKGLMTVHDFIDHLLQ